VGWNSLEHLIPCLESIYTHPPSCEFEVIYVDNASTDKSVKFIKENYPEVRIIENKKNEGFQRANNQALKIAKGRYVVLLNADTMILPDTFNIMLNFFDEHPDAGSANPKCVYPDGQLQWSYARFPKIKDFLYWFISSHRSLNGFFPKNRKDDSEELSRNKEQDYTYGAFFMIPKKVINSIGLMDEKFYMAGGDIAWSYKIKKSGWKNYYVAEAKIIHNERKSARRKSSTAAQVDWIRAHRRLLYHYFNFFQGILGDFIFLSHIFISLINSFFSFERKNKRNNLTPKDWFLTLKSVYVKNCMKFED